METRESLEKYVNLCESDLQNAREYDRELEKRVILGGETHLRGQLADSDAKIKNCEERLKKAKADLAAFDRNPTGYKIGQLSKSASELERQVDEQRKEISKNAGYIYYYKRRGERDGVWGYENEIKNAEQSKKRDGDSLRMVRERLYAARRHGYWASHQSEWKKLMSERDSLNKQIEQLNNEREAIPGYREMIANQQQFELNEEHLHLTSEVEAINKITAPILDRIKAIDNELTKER